MSVVVWLKIMKSLPFFFFRTPDRSCPDSLGRKKPAWVNSEENMLPPERVTSKWRNLSNFLIKGFGQIKFLHQLYHN